MSVTHIFEPLWGRVPKSLFVYATLRPEENDRCGIIEILSVHRDFFFLDKFLKDKASRRMTVLDQRKDTRSPRCQEWRHQYYVLFHEHNIPWFIPSSVISTLLELNNKGVFWMSIDLASLIWDIHCFVFRGVQLYKMANSHQIRH